MRAVRVVLAACLSVAALPALAPAGAEESVLPDLEITDASAVFHLVPSAQYGYSPYNRYTFTVHNLGDADASNVILKIYTGSHSPSAAITSQAPLGTIAAGSTETFTLERNGVPQAYVCLRLDPANAIAESDETNNEACVVEGAEAPV